MPEYLESLVVLQDIVAFQSRLAAKVKTSIDLEPADIEEHLRGGVPLLYSVQPKVPAEQFMQALHELFPLLPEDSPAQLALKRLVEPPYLESATVESLLRDLVDDWRAACDHLASVVGSDAETINMLILIVLAPFYCREIKPYRQFLEACSWRRGYCPACGAYPGMARLAHDDGRRVLACLRCRTEWDFDRLGCPFCERVKQPRLTYFTMEGVWGYRVACCTECNGYIKMVDERLLDRRVDLFVEYMITSHLDEAARQQGYH